MKPEKIGMPARLNSADMMANAANGDRRDKPARSEMFSLPSATTWKAMIPPNAASVVNR